MEEIENLYKINDVCVLLGVSKKWLETKIKEGSVEVIWLGGVRRIKHSELKRIMEKGIE